MVQAATPQWRIGPKNKPVLCNACGSRYRQRGTLDNYLPKCRDPKLDVKDKPSSSDPNSGKKNPVIWNPKIPSKKRSPQISRIERIQKQFLDLWNNLGLPNEPSPEDLLLFHNVNNLIPSNEIGPGCIRL
ncbi:GATA transcription factor 27-like [Gastrolobium bilobum]|uniref:GATA transcription factor 27-like n=1 Tax=Gastrolobium bilobum TaxID=150636 RepID=UPI002AB2C1D9|nr:GATA transcription factor 27-like [Gastrolobium bilobum]